MSGGSVGNTAKKECFALDNLHGRWHEQVLPDLVQARRSHCKCCIGNTVYVFAGYDGGIHLKSIESLTVRTARDAAITFVSP